MHQTESNNLFDINISDTSRDYIRKFATIARTITLISIIITVIRITQVLIRAIKIDPAIYRHNKLLLFEHNLMPYFMLGYSVLLCLSLYYYWKLGTGLASAVNNNDMIAFNKSFESLYRYSVYGLMTIVFTLLFDLFDFYLTLTRHLSR